MNASNVNHAYDAVCKAIADERDEATLWVLADELVRVAPKNTDVENVVAEAQHRGIPTKSANTLRLYRDVAKRFPSSERVPLVSFSAHREAIVLDDAKKARAILLELVSKHGVAGVSVTTVKSAIGAATGKVAPVKSSSKGGSVAQQSSHADIAIDLCKGGKLFIGAVPGMLTVKGVTLDGLRAGLNAVMADLDVKASKAARKAAAAKAPAAKPVGPNGSTAARKAVAAAKSVGKPAPSGKVKVGAGKAGDLRDL